MTEVTADAADSTPLEAAVERDEPAPPRSASALDRIRRGRAGRLLEPAGVAALAAAAATVIYFGNPTDPHNFLPVCPSKLLFGIDCPGCGGMRMVYSLLHGDLHAAVQYNAVALVVLPLIAWSWVSWTRTRLTGRRPARNWQTWRWSPMVVLTVVVGWGVIRNLPFPPFTSLYV